MTREQFLERLELERFTIPERHETTTNELRGWTPREQAEHRATLLDALTGDAVVVAWRERRSA